MFKGRLVRFRRRYISLIEVMIVMALLAMLVGVVSISITRAIQEERYRAGVTQLVNRLQMSQDIMLIARGDVALQLKMGKEGLECYFDVAQSLLPLLQRFIARANHEVIKGIGGFTWTPENGHEVVDQPVWLNFKSGGTRLSRGELRVSIGQGSDKSGSQAYILLAGMGQPLVADNVSRFDSLKPGVNAEAMLEKLYPAEVKEAANAAIVRQKQEEQKQSG